MLGGRLFLPWQGLQGVVPLRHRLPFLVRVSVGGGRKASSVAQEQGGQSGRNKAPVARRDRLNSV